MDLESLRREYLQGGLSRADLAEDPIDQFSAWMQQAIDLGISRPDGYDDCYGLSRWPA